MPRQNEDIKRQRKNTERKTKKKHVEREKVRKIKLIVNVDVKERGGEINI